MCLMCDRPELDGDDYLEHVRAIVRRNRFAIQAVGGSRCHAELSYSVGLTAHGLPELVVTALRSEEASKLIGVWSEYLLEKNLVLPGETLECGPYVMEAIEVERPEEHLFVASALYGDRVRGLQLAWADERGVWPWQPGHRARRAGQPVLGPRTSYYCDEHRTDRLEVPPHL